MAILRPSEIRKLGEKELENKVAELKKELMKLRAQVASGTPPENAGRVRAIRKTLAKVNTVKSEKKKGGKKK